MVAQTSVGVFGLIVFGGQPGREAEQLAFTTTLAPHSAKRSQTFLIAQANRLSNQNR